MELLKDALGWGLVVAFSVFLGGVIVLTGTQIIFSDLDIFMKLGIIVYGKTFINIDEISSIDETTTNDNDIFATSGKYVKKY